MVDARDAYEHCADEFLRRRDSSMVGSKIVERWSRTLPEGALGLELGCGGGYPVTQILDNARFKLWAIDGSPTLVAKFQTRFPHIEIQCARVQEYDCFDRTFDFAIAIGLIFLLPEPDQVDLVSKVSHILEPGGRFLLTAPFESGRWVDEIAGIECHSLGRVRYESVFEQAGFRVVTTYADDGKNNYFHLKRS